MAATAAPEPLEPSEMECSVCHEYFTQPKILPCAHLLCQHCLVSWLNSHPDACCPLCRCTIVDPQEPATCRSAQEVADALPTDVTMAGLVAGARALSQDHVCVACENVAAHFICLDCNDMLCQACNKTHKKLSATKNHITADLATMTPERLAASCHVTCAVHGGKRAKLFCASHTEAICNTCATARHRACLEVRELGEKLVEKQKVLGELLELLTGGEIQLEAAIRELDDHLLQVEKKTERTLADITATCDDLKKAVDAFGSQMREAALSAKYKAREEVEQVKSAFMQRKGKLTSHKQLVKRTKRVATSTSDGVDGTSLKTRVEGLDRTVTLPVGVNVITMPTLVTDQQAIERVQKELEGVCKLENTPAKLSFQRPRVVSRDPFTFHENHGDNVVLSNNQRTAQRVDDDDEDDDDDDCNDGYCDGTVLSSQPMEVSLLYEVVIEQNDPSSGDTMLAGVTTADPHQLNLSGWATLNYAESLGIFNCGYDKAFGTELSTDFGETLVNLPVGSRVGFYLDAARNLHFVVDGCDQGVVCEDVPQPCYAFFDLWRNCTQITALPLTPMS